MWVYTKRGFISAVEDKDERGMILVRARFRGHLEALFPGEKIEYTPSSDYRYRTRIPRLVFASAVEMMAADIDYANFKKAVDPFDELYVWACAQVWGTMARAQEAEPNLEPGEGRTTWSGDW